MTKLEKFIKKNNVIFGKKNNKLKNLKERTIEKFLEDRNYSVSTEHCNTGTVYIKAFNQLEEFQGVIRISDHRNQSRISNSNVDDDFNIVEDEFFDKKRTIRKIEEYFTPIAKMDGLTYCDWGDEECDKVEFPYTFTDEDEKIAKKLLRR